MWGQRAECSMLSGSVRFHLHAIPAAYRRKNYMWFPLQVGSWKTERQLGSSHCVTLRAFLWAKFLSNMASPRQLWGKIQRGNFRHMHTHAWHLSTFMCLLLMKKWILMAYSWALKLNEVADWIQKRGSNSRRQEIQVLVTVIAMESMSTQSEDAAPKEPYGYPYKSVQRKQGPSSQDIHI